GAIAGDVDGLDAADAAAREPGHVEVDVVAVEDQRVVAGAAVGQLEVEVGNADGVVADTAAQDVLAAQAQQQIVALLAGDLVRAEAAEHDIAAGGADVHQRAAEVRTGQDVGAARVEAVLVVVRLAEHQ